MPARLLVSKLLDERARIAMLVAKATFHFTEGRTQLDTQSPYPVQLVDVETDLGLLPRDDLPRRDPVFEVMVLAAAHAPGGTPAARQSVSVAVGEERRELAVFGDRRWEIVDGQPRITEPAPFLRMPLTYANAFGGTCSVEVDHEAFMDVFDIRNREGKGFDPTPQIEALTSYLRPPTGYPRYDAVRALPNVEDPEKLIRDWGDAPDPAGWAPLPCDSGVHAARSITAPLAWDANGLAAAIADGVYHRAHPSWVIKPPPPGCQIVLTGLQKGRAVTSFPLPSLRVVFDYVAGSQGGVRELVPDTLVLLPEVGHFYLVYRHVFTFDAGVGERAMRIRMDGHDVARPHLMEA